MANTAPAFDLVLSDLVSSYKVEEIAPAKPAKIRLIKDSVRVEKVVDRSKVETTTVPALVPATNSEEPKSETRVIALKVSLDAKGFLVAMRNAGYRKDNQGKSFLDKNEIRPDSIKAIEAFIGYDAKGNFASQELAARTEAMRQIRQAKGEGPTKEQLLSAPTRQEIRRANASLMGFVNGNPDLRAQKVADLEGRERLATDTLIEQEKLAETLPTEQERSKALALAQLERERIAEIRKDLAALGK